MAQRRSRKPPQPLDQAKLRELALAYVGRFSTTRAKLRTYLSRKIRERGWSDGQAADVETIAEAMADRGYIDDRGYALAKSRALTARGLGRHRVQQKLHAAGVANDDGVAARDHAEEHAVASALRFAQRRRIGPFAAAPMDPPAREKAIAAMIRAGHGFGLSRMIAELEPEAECDLADLEERVRTATA